MPGSKAQEPDDAKRGQHANRAAVMCLNIAADRDSHQHFKNRGCLLADVRVIPLSIASGGRLCNATYDVDYSKERTTLRPVGGNRTLLLTPCHGCAKFTVSCRGAVAQQLVLSTMISHRDWAGLKHAFSTSCCVHATKAGAFRNLAQHAQPCTCLRCGHRHRGAGSANHAHATPLVHRGVCLSLIHI